MYIDYKSIISPGPPPQHSIEANTCTGLRRALRDPQTMASLVHVAQLHVKPPYFNADNTRKLRNTSQGLCWVSVTSLSLEATSCRQPPATPLLSKRNALKRAGSHHSAQIRLGCKSSNKM